jgi:hypothetical protein
MSALWCFDVCTLLAKSAIHQFLYCDDVLSCLCGCLLFPSLLCSRLDGPIGS